jgi:CubicO group peptidase (beta-lactamase class C family)
MLAGWGQFNGTRILKAETLKEMFRNQVLPGGGNSFGLGFAVERAKISGADKPLGQYGWAGYANTEFRVIPDAGVSMVFMRQTIPTTHQMSQKLFGILRRGMKIN